MKFFSGSKDTSTYYNAAAVKTFLNRKKGTKDYYNADNTFKGYPDSGTKTQENVANRNETAPVNKIPKKTDKKRILNAITNNDIRKKSIGIPWSNYIAFMGVKNLADKDVVDAAPNTSSSLMQPLQCQCKCQCSSKKRISVLCKKSSGKFSEHFKEKIRVQKGHSRPEKKSEDKFTQKHPEFVQLKPKIYYDSSSNVPSKSSLTIPLEKSPSSKTNIDSSEEMKKPEETTVNEESAGKRHVEFEKSLSEPTAKQEEQPRRRSMFDLENLSILERASVVASKNQNKDKNHKLSDAFGRTIFKHKANSQLQMQVEKKSVTQQKSGERITQKLSSHVDSNKQTEKTENEKCVERYKFSSSELHKCKDQESKASSIEDVISVINYDDSDPLKRMSSNSRMNTITKLITKIEIIKDLLPIYQSSSENGSIKDTLKRQLLTNEDALDITIADELIEEFLCANQMGGAESVPNENGTGAIQESGGSGSTNATLLVTWKDLVKHFSPPLEPVESKNQTKFRVENTLTDKYIKNCTKGKNKNISNQVHKSIITVDAADSNSYAHALWEGKATYQIQNIFECDSLENVSEKTLPTHPSHGTGYAVDQSKKAMKHFCDFDNASSCQNVIISEFIKQKSQPIQNKTDSRNCNKMENSLSFHTLKTKLSHESEAAHEMTEDSLEGERHKSMDCPPRKVLRTFKQRFTAQTEESSTDDTPIKTKPKKKVHYLTYPVQTSYNDHMGINLECLTNINLPKKELPSKLPILRTRKVKKVTEEFPKGSSKLSINKRSPSRLSKGEEDSKSFVTVSGDTSATSSDGCDRAIKGRILKMSKNVKAVSATDNKRPPYVKQRKIYSKSATETLPKLSAKRTKDTITKRRSDQSKVSAKSRLPVLQEKESSDSRDESKMSKLQEKDAKELCKKSKESVLHSENESSDSTATDENKMSKLQEKDVKELCKKSKESVLQSENEVKCSEESKKEQEIIMKDVEIISPDCSNVRRRTLEKCKVEVMLQSEESENKNVYIIKSLLNDKQTSSTGVVEKCLKLETANQTTTTCSKEIGTKVASLTLIAVTQTDISNEDNKKIPKDITNVDCPKQSMLDEKEVEETTQTLIEDGIQEHVTDDVNRENVGVSEKEVFTLPSITVYNKEYLDSLRCFNPSGIGHVFDNVEVFNYNVQYDRHYNRSVTFSEVSVNSDLRYLDSDDEPESSKDRKCCKRRSPQKCLKKTCPTLCRAQTSAIVTECACQYDGDDYKNTEMRCECPNWRKSSSKKRRSRIPILVRYEIPQIECTECCSVASEANTSLEEKPSQHMWTATNIDDCDMKSSQTSFSSNECRLQDKHCSNSSLCSNGHSSDGKRRSNSTLRSNGHPSNCKERCSSSLRSTMVLSKRDMSVSSSDREIQPELLKDICDQGCSAKMCIEKDTSTSTPKTQKSIASQFSSNETRTSHRLKATYKIRDNGSYDSVISISKEDFRSSKKHRERWGSLMASLSRKKHSKTTLENKKRDKHSKKKYWKEFVSSFRNQKCNPRDNQHIRDHCHCDHQVRPKRSSGEIPCKKRCPSDKNSSRASSRKTVYYNDVYPNYPLNTSTYSTIFTKECGNPNSIEVLYPANEINTTETCESETITIAATKHSKMCVNSQTRSIEILTKPHHEVLRSQSEYLDNEDVILDNTFCDFVVKDDDSTNFLDYNKKLQQCYHHCTCGQILKIEVIKNSETSL